MAPQWPSNWGSGGKGKANRVVVRVLACQSLARTVLFVCQGWLGSSRSQARTCQGEASCSSCFPKTKETPCIAGSRVLGCWVCCCLITWPPTPALLFTPRSQWPSGSSFLFLSLHSRFTLYCTRAGKRGELALLPPDLASSLPMESSRTLLFKVIWHTVLLCRANMRHTPQRQVQQYSDRFMPRSLKRVLWTCVWISWQCQIAMKVSKYLHSISMLHTSWASNKKFMDQHQFADHSLNSIVREP